MLTDLVFRRESASSPNPRKRAEAASAIHKSLALLRREFGCGTALPHGQEMR